MLIAWKVFFLNIIDLLDSFFQMGAYHTLDLELNRPFTLFKHEWDSVALGRIEEACDPTQTADLAAVIMQEGIAHVCLVTNAMTLVRAKIETSIPRKRKGLCEQHTKVQSRL
jgi:protein pelota